MTSRAPLLAALLLTHTVAAVALGQVAVASADSDRVSGNLVQFNDNGGWCWYQDPRVVVDASAGALLVGSVAAAEGPGGAARSGNVELTTYEWATGRRRTAVLHAQLEADDHDVAALRIRPDGRYLAVYSTHKRDPLSRWRISLDPHDASRWTEERVFDWSTIAPDTRATYANLHHLSADGRLYNFVRAVNQDPSILVSADEGDSWSYGGKLLTIERFAYTNGYMRYASNGADRVDFITTEHHPRNFNNSIYHGYVSGGALFDSSGTMIDANVLDPDGHAQTELTRVFAANTVVGGEAMTRAWTTDLQLDADGRPVAIFTCRANDVPENSNFNDHRFFYARFDGRQWQVHQLARAGAPLFPGEQDYTGLAALDPHDPRTVYVSTPIDPRTGTALAHHEIFKGVTADGGASWLWSALTERSSVDNLRPIVPRWDADHTAVLWLRGTMRRSQHYDLAVVGLVESPVGSPSPVRYVAADAAARQTRLTGLADGTYDLFAFFRGSDSGDAAIRAGLSADDLMLFRQRTSQRAERSQFDPSGAPAEGLDLYRAYLGRVRVSGSEAPVVWTDASRQTSFTGVGYAAVGGSSAMRSVETVESTSANLDAVAGAVRDALPP